MWPMGWYESILLDKSDRRLRQLDRRIRRALARGVPSRWSPPSEGVLEPEREGRSLLDIYESLFLSNLGNWQEAAGLLKRVLTNSQTSHIRARALQMLCQILYTESINMRAEGKTQPAEELDKQCRELCVAALPELESQPWVGAVRHVLHGALGVLDYYSGEKATAEIHLNKALEEYASIRTGYDRRNPSTGVVYFHLGLLANERCDYESGVKYHSLAVRELPEHLKMNALSDLSCALLRLGLIRRARKYARRGLRAASRSNSPESIDRLKGYLSEAELRLGNLAAAKRLINESAGTGLEAEWKRKARGWIESLEGKKEDRL